MNHHNLYTLANDELQLSSNLEDLNWNSTDSHKGELVIAYDNKVGNNTLHPRSFYALYVKPNENGTKHLIYRPSTNQMVFTKDYWTVPVPKDLVDTIWKTDLYDNKSQVDDFDMIHSIVHDGQSNNNDNDVHNPFSDDNQCLHETVNTILPLQQSLKVLIHEDIYTISSMTPSRLYMYYCHYWCIYGMKFYDHLYLRLYEINSYNGVKFYVHLHLHLYEGNLYLHLHLHLYKVILH